MIIIAESGATKTAWRAVTADGTVTALYTDGLSPTCIDAERMREIIASAIPVLNPGGACVEEVFFYGAGLVAEESFSPLRETLELWCPFTEIAFASDLLAAARALFADGSGVVAIMGTGSNSCLYENGRIVRNIRPGGYVLGDEGGGVALGKAFLSDFVKEMLPEDIEREFVAEFGLDYAAIVRKVYKEPAASAFMASIAPFVVSRLSNDYMHALVENCLETFVMRALGRYHAEAPGFKAASTVGVVGSFGYACRDMLGMIGRRHGLEFVRFLPSPIDELVNYHKNVI